MPFKDYRITSPFGWRNNPFGGGREFHTGIDLVKSHKAPIEAFTDGEVLYAGLGLTGTGLGGYGNVVLIKDKNNRGQLYAHLDSVSVKNGQKVRKGQVVGYQGATGRVTGSHLHYEVRKKAENKPPYGWVADRENNCLNPTEYLKYFYESEKLAGEKYKIKKGDTFWDLENKFGLKHGTLQKLNPVVDPKKLRIGQVIKIGEGKTDEKEYYTIKKGDTFWELENRFKLKHGTLQKLNPGVDPRKLRVGQKIRVK